MEENQAAEAAQRRLYTIATVQVDGDERPAPRGGASLTLVRLETCRHIGSFSGLVELILRRVVSCCKAGNGDVYLIGGANREAQSFGDVHVFHVATKQWEVVAASGERFPARSGHSAVSIGSRIYVFGGMNPIECAVYEDVFAFDAQTNQWSLPLIEGWMPAARNAHAAIQLPPCDGHERMLVYGGSSPESGPFDDVYILHLPVDPEAPLRWERRECAGPELPEARELHVACFLTATTILFSGGRNKDGNVCTDMALLDIETWQWQLIPICEWNRCSHAAALVNSQIVSFGGFDGGAIRDDCWEYVDNEESWLRVSMQREDTNAKRESEPESAVAEPAVAARFGHCGCAVKTAEMDGTATKHTEVLLVFGGMNEERDLNDLVLITSSDA